MIIEPTTKDIDRMKMLIQDDYEAEYTLATTNGVFDLLHVGHIRFLQSIKKIADILIVCVNSDESVRRIRQDPIRPIIPLAERMEILDALECVDYVVAFEEDTPTEILSKIRPDIHIKDSSYAGKDIPERETVLVNGGKIFYADRLPDHSTTDIVATIIGRYRMQTEKRTSLHKANNAI